MSTPSTTCKACNITSSGMINIYAHPNNLDSMYSFVSGIEEINVSDALCVPCYDDLKIAFNFKQKCIQTELMRRNEETSLNIKDEQKKISTHLPASSTRNHDAVVEEEITDTGATSPTLAAAQSSSEIVVNKTEVDGEIGNEFISILDLNEVCDNDEDISEVETADRDKNLSIELISDVIEYEDLSKEIDAFNCSECGKAFNRSSNLRRHQKMVHFISETKICTNIGRTRSQNGATTKLIANDIFNSLKETQCEYCFIHFESNSLRKAHELGHKSEEKPYRCNFENCSSHFKERFGLRKHLDTHSSVKKFQCRYCDQRFHQRGNARSHERYHTGEKPYICDHCGKSFAESGNLKAHIRFHTGERPYKCPECPKRFTTHYSHKIHIRSHTKERPYLCSDCGKRFSSSGKLLVHKRIHSGQRPYKCDLCSSAFVDSSGLKRHSKIH